MFIIYFLLPILFTVLAEIPSIRQKGYRESLLSLGLKLLYSVAFTVLLLIFLFMDFGAFLSVSGIKLLAALLGAIMAPLLIKGIAWIRKSGSLLWALAFSFAVVLFLEGTIFNFRFYQSFEYEEIDASEYYELSPYFYPTEERENEYYFRSSEAIIELENLNMKVNNLYLDITARNSYDRIVSSNVSVYMTDESNANYLELPAQNMIGTVESSKYFYLGTNGVSEKLRLELSSDLGKAYQIESIRINVPQPFQFNLWRLIILTALIFVFWLLRPSSKIYSYGFTDSAKQRCITVVVIMAEILLLLFISVANPAFIGNPSKHTAQYQQLADSFLDGQLYLDQEPPEYLAEMENPYDTYERQHEAAISGKGYYWDAAYYEGHYYVYFGVVPVLLLYLPFKVLTGMNLPNFMAIDFFLCFFVVGAFLLLAEILKKYFATKKIPYVSYLLLSLIFVNASGAVFIAKRPDFYSVPILAGLSFTLFGLYFWMKSQKEGRVRPFFAAIGSLCMALVAGCRPQLLLVSAMAFPLFWKAVFQERSLFSKKGWKSTVAICLPYVIVAAGIMWYNYARFGSPFDFGANYNLTTNDMTGRGYRVERLGLAFFTYFFQLPNLTAAFPFLEDTVIQSNYLGNTITEPMFGGIFIVIPLLWILCLLPSRRKAMQEQGIFAICLLPLVLSIVIGLFDAQGAGLLQRYVSDFAFLACLSAIVLFYLVIEKSRGARKQSLHQFLRFATYGSGIYCFMCVFAKYSVELYYYNPHLFHRVSEMVQFW